MIVPKINSWEQALQHFLIFLNPETINGPFFLNIMKMNFHDPFSYFDEHRDFLDQNLTTSYWRTMSYLIRNPFGNFKGPSCNNFSVFFQYSHYQKLDLKNISTIINDPWLAVCLPYIMDKTLSIHTSHNFIFQSNNDPYPPITLDFTKYANQFITELKQWDKPYGSIIIDFHEIK